MSETTDSNLVVSETLYRELSDGFRTDYETARGYEGEARKWKRIAAGAGAVAAISFLVGLGLHAPVKAESAFALATVAAVTGSKGSSLAERKYRTDAASHAVSDFSVAAASGLTPEAWTYPAIVSLIGTTLEVNGQHVTLVDPAENDGQAWLQIQRDIPGSIA